MTQDRVADTFNRWLEAHKRHIEAQRRLAEAQRICRQTGGQPPQFLIDEVAGLKKETDELLAAAQAALNQAHKQG